MRVAELIEAHRDDLTPAERRVAEVVLTDPEAVAFGTVAGLGERAGTSGATVVRLALRLGYDGFVALQAGVQEELTRRLRATERIREPSPPDVVGQTLATELANLQTTLQQINARDFETAVKLLSGRNSKVHVLAGAASHGIATGFANELSMLRPDVLVLWGPDAHVARQLSDVDRGDVVVAIDLRRYDRWVLATTRYTFTHGASVIAITDSRLSPLAADAAVTFVAGAEGAGPFDSHVGVLALGNALLNAVAARLRNTAAARLDQVEEAWRRAGALTDG
jgi:DNA-binding MurR/RpiR family transcriptional regulator